MDSAPLTAHPPLRGLAALDARLLDATAVPGLAGARRFLREFIAFGIKEARACLFVGLFFLGVFLVPREGIGDFRWYVATAAVPRPHA